MKKMSFLDQMKMKAKGMTAVDGKNINKLFNFDDIESCKKFLTTLHIGTARVECIRLENGQQVKMEDIPEDQIIQRAKELRGWIHGKPAMVKNE